MLALRQTAWSLVALPRHLFRVARNILLLPVIVTRVSRGLLADVAGEPDMDALRTHLLLPFSDDFEETDRQARLDALIATIHARDWDSLLKRLSACETARRHTAGRSSYIAETLATVGEAVARQAEAGETALLDALEDGAAAHPGSHLMAALLAMAHIGLGWQARGTGFVPDIDPASADRFRAHFHRADRLLAPFDAVERYSPALAMAQYMLYPAHPEAGERIEDWFADWADLAPGTVNPYLTHGAQMLPKWFGADDAALDRAALRAAADSRDIWGNAGYTLTWLGAMDGAEPAQLAHCDGDLFLEGLTDLLDRSPSQHLVNRTALRLFRAWRARHVSPGPDPVARAVAALQNRLGDGFRLVVGKYLHYGLPSVWGGEDDCLWHVGHAFLDEIAAGASIRFGERGAEIAFAEGPPAP
ncbi:MAG: hypothetical protein R3D85_07775 [Paracoccaceae bacterium]